MKNNHTPEIRFPGFTEDWEQRKLGDVSIRVRGNDGRMELPTLTISAGSGWLDQRDRFSGNIAGKEQENYTLLTKGHLSYNHGNSKLAKYGVVFELRTYEEALVPRVYHSFKTTNEASANFIEYMFATKLPDRELAKLVSSGARMDGLLNINYDDFMGIKINIPKIDEQNRLAQYFRKLDDTINLHQQELTTLKQTKKGFLQKIFPKEGESGPEIRFPGFTEDWEQRNILDVSKVFIGLVTTMTENYRESGTLLIRNSDIKENRFEFSYNPIHLDESFAEQNRTRRLIIGDVVTVHTGDIGTSAVITERENGSIGFATINSRPNPNLLDSNYLATFFNTERHKNYAIKMSTGDGRSNYNLKDFNKLTVPLPSIEEQKKIGLFFNCLDKTIALHQKELELLQETKKAFLQKMFA